MDEEGTARRGRQPSLVETNVATRDDSLALLDKLSMNEMTTYRWSLLDDVVAYRKAGYAAIGVWRPKLVEFGEERGCELLCDSGLTVSSISWAGGFTGSHGHSFREAVDDARDVLRTAAAVNAECLVIVSGCRAGHTANHARRLLVSGLRALADEAAEYDVRLALQPMHPMFASEWSFLTTLDETVDVLDRCDHEAVGMAFDVYHLWQEPRLLERIPEIAPSVSLVQLSDWRDPPRSEVDRCRLGEGEIPLRDIVQTFAQSGYNGYYEVEIWSEELWRSDYEALLAHSRSRFQAMCRQ